MTAELADLDPAEIKASHTGHSRHRGHYCGLGRGDGMPCDAYRLAEVLAEVLALHVEWASVEVDDLTRTQAIYKRMGTVLGFTYDEPAEPDPYGRSADR